MVHEFIIIIAVGIILFFQWYVYIKNKKQIYNFNRIFPDKRFLNTLTVYIPKDAIASFKCEDLNDSHYRTPHSETDIEITLIAVDSRNPVLKNITDSINTYLIKNKGAVSDFMLIKDIVNRNCDAEDEEINTQLPIPLYLGLIGTMLGIIIGIGYIALTGGGFKAFIDNPEESIGTLMGGVAIAMFASLFGIGLTTYGSWIAKNAKTALERNKNQYFTWIQTELLPVLSGNTTNALHILQSNLVKFNESFSSNISKMDGALEQVTDSYGNQIELLRMLEEIDIKQVALANVKVLKELQCNTKEFERFNAYMFNVNEYLTGVRDLNESINEHLNRTAAIEKMGRFFENEIEAIDQRKDQISKAVINVDDILRKSFVELQENAQKGMENIYKSLTYQQEDFHKTMLLQQEKIKEHIPELEAVFDELKELTVIKECVQNWEKTTLEQNNQLQSLTHTIKELVKSLNSRKDCEEEKKNLKSPVGLSGYVKYLFRGRSKPAEKTTSMPEIDTSAQFSMNADPKGGREEKIFKKIYAEQPDDQNQFQRITDSFISGASIYEIALSEDGRRGLFSICNDPDTMERAIKNKNTLLNDACEFKGESSNSTRIVMERKGRTELGPSNQWIIVEKAVISFK